MFLSKKTLNNTLIKAREERMGRRLVHFQCDKRIFYRAFFYGTFSRGSRIREWFLLFGDLVIDEF